MKYLFLIIASLWCGWSQAQMQSLIPTNTATHVAINNGNWFDPGTWNTSTVPEDAAIVHIPTGVSVVYEGSSTSHIFALRVDGTIVIQQTNSANVTDLTIDTFLGTMSSIVRVDANGPTDGKINIVFSPFDIEAHKNGTSGYTQVWNANAIAHYSDGATSYHVEYAAGPTTNHDTYLDALQSNTTVTETLRVAVDDGPGVIGRHGWDSTQVSLGLITMGQLEILGQTKDNMMPLSADALIGQSTISLAQAPQGWLPNDELIITRGGGQGTVSPGEDRVSIASVSAGALALNSPLTRNHFNNPSENLYCHVGNLTRNITFSSASSDSTQRGHMMAMNDLNVQVRDAAFYDMGRTDKSKLLNDFVWKNWRQTPERSVYGALGHECVEMKRNAKEDISNIRGRYSIHLHKLGATATSNMAYITGNVVWGNPGWGITHHDSHADVSDNVVYDVTGAGIVSESGSETGVWNHNLLVDIKKGHTERDYDAALWFDDYLFNGQALGMKGRSVVCNDNVIAKANVAVGVMNMSPSVQNVDRVDPLALAARPEHPVNHWPLSVNGYSAYGDGVQAQEPALIVNNTLAIWCYQGLRSIERDQGVNHESRSFFDGFKCWGVVQGLSIVYQTDYTFRDVYISGKNMNAIGMYMWKHSFNHVFDNVKLEDLGYGVACSRLVENNNGNNQRVRNNGFTPWYFIDLTTTNVTQLYKIEKDNPVTSTIYDEHGDNTIHLSSNDFSSRPTTFTILDSTELYVDYAAADFEFEIDGIVTDELGSYDLGVKQPLAQPAFRVDYPERLYEFASTAKFEEYLMNNGVYEDPITNELYFIIQEFVPDRRTNQYVGFPIRIEIRNAPSTGVFANPQTEPAANFQPEWHIVSRLTATNATQSSTNLSVSYKGNSIDVGPQKCVDGNTNGRINAQEYQQGHVPIGSFSQTNVESEPWYELDLGADKLIEYIDIWSFVNINGSDMETLDSEFKDFYVLISDVPFGNANLSTAQGIANYQYYKDNSLQRKFSMKNMGARGRYIRIQGAGNRMLRLSEVEVIGKECQHDATDDIISSCSPLIWIDGNTYSTSNNTATHTLTNAAGCDSVVTLNYTKLTPSTGVDAVTSCSPLAWIDGNTYSTSNNTATHTLTNAAGCDSVVTLNYTKLTPSTGVDVVTSCSPLAWIDGNTYSSSNNTATHTLTNAAGCDSVVTLNYTKLPSSTGIDVVASCSPLVWIDGNTYSTSNNTATHTLTNAAGCDSVVTLNYTKLTPSTGVDAVTSCSPLAWIDGNTYSSSNNTATHTLTNAAGCDSVVTLNYTKLPSSTGIDVVASCSPLVWIDGNTYSTSNNTATHTLTNAAGCDSVVTLNYTKLTPSTGVDIVTSCSPLAWIDGNTYSASNNTATHTLTNAAGCDSVVTLNYTLLTASAGVDVISSCSSLVWIDGNTYSTSNNTATHTLTNAAGCDSVVTLDFTMNGITATIAQNNLVLTANPSGASYQWIDCADNSAILAATNQNYSPTQNGDYAVIVTQNGCVDTSACINVIIDGLEEQAEAFGVQIFPNPSNGEFTVALDAEYTNAELVVYDSRGRLIHKQGLNANTQHVKIDAAPGIYQVLVTVENAVVHKRLVIR